MNGVPRSPFVHRDGRRLPGRGNALELLQFVRVVSCGSGSPFGAKLPPDVWDNLSM